jgi:small subunit ribosomal protein S14
MAKKSKIAKNERRREVVARYAARRAELKEILRRPSSTEAERAAAREEPRRRPRDASGTRVRNRDSVDDRDSVDGRPRGHLRTFGLSWVNLRGGAGACGIPAGRPQVILVARRAVRRRRGTPDASPTPSDDDPTPPRNHDPTPPRNHDPATPSEDS